jgi:heat shock protein 1/8
MEDDKITSKISNIDKDTLLAKCEEVIQWLDGNQTAEKEEFEHQKKELERVSNPIMSKLYQQGGMPEGGMPGAAPQGGASDGASAGPTIEEVD